LAGVFFLSKIGKEGLGAGFILFLLISNLFVTKEIHAWGLTLTVCDVYTVGSILCLNLIQEIYDKKTSRKYLYLGMIILSFFLVMSHFQVTYFPTDHSRAFSDAFDKILIHTPRIVGASLLVTFISDTIDMKVFNFLKNRSPHFPFPYRFLISTVGSQLLDTVLFSFIGLYGIVENLWHCIWVSYGIKVLFVLAITFFSLYVTKDFYTPRHFWRGEKTPRGKNRESLEGK